MNTQPARKMGKAIACIGFLLLLVIGIIALQRYLKSDNSQDSNAKGKEGQQENGELVDPPNRESDGQTADRESDGEGPVIQLQGETQVTVKLGIPYTEPGYQAQDSEGKDMTPQVKTSGVDWNRAGEYELLYEVEDSRGRIGRASRKVTVEPNTEYETNGLAICMYHYVYDRTAPPENLNNNFIEKDTLAGELQYLKNNEYYFPSWREVRDYLDGKLLLPEKSVVLTFDDGPTFMDIGIPMLEEYQIPATSFVITSYFTDHDMLAGYGNDYLTFESHSHKMHQGGGSIGHGGIFTAMSREDALTDLRTSIEICGSGDAFAYPFGDYTKECRDIVEEAGFLCAVTTENAKCFPGADPLLLPRVRMLGEQSLDSFAASIR